MVYYVTGATGHLGRNLLLLLLTKEASIVALKLPSDTHTDFGEKGKKEITWVDGDLTSEDDLRRFFAASSDPDAYLFHIAGLITIYKKVSPKLLEVNVEGTRKVIDSALARHVRKMVYVSSVDSIAKGKKGIVTEPASFDESLLDGAYGKSKAMANNLVLEANKKGLEALIVMPSALLGPNDPFGGPMNEALRMFGKGKLRAIVTGGYDLVDVRDVANGLLLALEKGKPGSSYILSGHPIKIKDLIKLSSKITGLPSYLIILPASFVKLFAPILESISKHKHQKPLFTAYSMECLLMNYNYSNKKAIEEIGYSSRPLEDTLKDTFRFLGIPVK